MLEGVGHAYGDHVVLIDVNLHVERGQKVVLHRAERQRQEHAAADRGGRSSSRRRAASSGPSGRARRYYDQHQDEVLDPASTVLEEVRAVAPAEPEVRLRTVLGQFLFHGDDVFKTVGVLSGGERSRVALAKFLHPADRTCCCSTSRRTTWTGRRGASSSRRWSGTRARSSARATTRRSWTAWRRACTRSPTAAARRCWSAGRTTAPQAVSLDRPAVVNIAHVRCRHDVKQDVTMQVDTYR